MYAVDVPAFVKVMNDPTVLLPWDKGRAFSQHADRRHSPVKSGIFDRGGDRRGGRSLRRRLAALSWRGAQAASQLPLRDRAI